MRSQQSCDVDLSHKSFDKQLSAGPEGVVVVGIGAKQKKDVRRCLAGGYQSPRFWDTETWRVGTNRFLRPETIRFLEARMVRGWSWSRSGEVINGKGQIVRREEGERQTSGKRKDVRRW